MKNSKRQDQGDRSSVMGFTGAAMIAAPLVT